MKVIKRLRVKIIISIVAVQTFVLCLIFFGLNFAISVHRNHLADSFLKELSENNGHRLLPLNQNGFAPPEPAFLNGSQNSANFDFHNEKRPEDFHKNAFDFIQREDLRNYFSVNVSYSGAINEIISDFPLSYTEDEISEIVILITKDEKFAGTVKNFQYLKKADKYGTFLLCVLNRSEDFRIIRQFHFYGFWISLGILTTSFLIALVVSKIALSRAEETFERQKRFIADAGHELKTPIAVIGANIDVLSSDENLNSNKFFQYIKRENERMGELVRDLLYLARDDADRLEMIKAEFDFSNAVENAVLPFEVVAFENGMTLKMEIQKGIMCQGDEKSLKQLFVILVDNAIKNSEKGAVITVKAYTERQNIIYKVRNTGMGIKKDDLKKIFERFYRADTSRARKTGGYGLGLSIAQSIAQKHGGVIKAESEYGKYAEFTFKMKT